MHNCLRKPIETSATVTFALIRLTCLAQSHLLMNDWLEQCMKPQKSPFIMKVGKPELDGIRSPSVV